MKKTWWILAALFVLTVPLAAQNTSGANGLKNEQNALGYIVNPDSVVFSRTFSEWDAEWQQWAYSIPVANHPLFDYGDCSVGQGGPVWFLGGKFCGNGVPGCSTNNVQRSCTVPYGKYLYFPVSNGEDSALEQQVAEGGTTETEQIGWLRAHQDPFEGPIVNEYAIIDGVNVPHLERFSVQSIAFGFTIPDDNYLKAIYPPPNNDFKAGTYFPALDNGQYLMLAPLPPGPHVIKFGADFGGWGFNITYFLTVKK